MPIFTLALAIPMVLMKEPFILFSTNPNICSTLALTLDFSRLDFFLGIGKGSVLVPFFIYPVHHFLFDVDLFCPFPCVGTVGIKLLPLVWWCPADRQEPVNHIQRQLWRYTFGSALFWCQLLRGFCTRKNSRCFSWSSGPLYLSVPAYAGISPTAKGLSLLWPVVFLPVVSLFRHCNKAGIHHLSFIGQHPALVQLSIEGREQGFDGAWGDQLLPEMPVSPAVGNSVTFFHTQKSLEIDPVQNLLFQLFVRKIVEALDNQCFKKHQPIIRETSSFFLPCFTANCLICQVSALKNDR